MATKKIPLYIDIPSVTQVEEDAISTTVITNSTDYKGQIWNSTLNKVRVWNNDLQIFENTIKVDDLLNHIIIKQETDFPTPDVNGYINLANFTTYKISGNITGDFKFICGVKTSFVGVDRVNDKLISTTTGVMFDMDGTITTKSNILFGDLTIGCPNGTLLNVTSPTANQAVGMINITISATKNLGLINNISTWAMTNIVIRNGVTNSGFVVTGNNGTIKCRLAVFGNNVGTTFDFTSSTNEVLDFNNNQISCSSGQTFMSAIPASITVWGKMNDNAFTGAGTFINGVTETDNIWNFNGNLGITNSGFKNEELIGLSDGSNSIFTTSANFDTNKVKVFVNGVKQKIVNDYQLSNNNTVTFTFSPNSGEFLNIEY